MRTTCENNTLTIYLEGRIDSNNAVETDKEIAEAVAANTDAHLAIDTLVRTDRLLIKDMKTNKVLQIAQEIGRQPVLSFGNSSGDVSMHNYTLYNNRYRSAAFQLIADNDVQDYGNPDKGRSCGRSGRPWASP